MQMITTLAVKPITKANSKSTLWVLPVCYWPGDDNNHNFLTVAQDAKLKEQLHIAARMPRIDPHNSTRTVVHRNVGWALDGKAAGYCGGWAGWVSKLLTPSGRDLCTRPEIASREVESCTEKSRQELYAEANFFAVLYQKHCVHNPDDDIDAQCLELAQELADFFVLVGPASMVPWKAIVLNVVSGTGVILGGIIVTATDVSNTATGLILVFGAGVYVYIACVEAAPRAFTPTTSRNHKLLALGLFILGAAGIGFVLFGHEHCEGEGGHAH